jgi:RNA polymerase sigma-70 factor (ECF subfamily)
LDGEAELLALARKFDEGALAAIYDTYSEPLYRYIAFQVQSAEIAEDLVSEAFSRLLDALHQGRGPAQHLSAWLYRVAHNLCMDHFRAQARRPQTELDEQMAAPGPSVETQAADAILAAEMAAALDRLTARQRTVVILRDLVGLSSPEVARAVGLPVDAVKALRKRAIAALRRQLTPAPQGEDNV